MIVILYLYGLGKCFIIGSELRKHERHHTEPVKRKYSCDICNKSYTTLQHLEVHMRQYTDELPHGVMSE
ncbi:hypothetical protein EB796_005426 [Bugula neritina]|uniref:C2H2-type domain-containing protein n=1 Tax=Bugula neritina TaxID=10212 RepID=A0A7J7KC79_BUGNE|nr:hypothetical protein EB796_005426 [Bugula neritina]